MNEHLPPPDAEIETNIRSLLSSLRRSADADTCEVLAEATNTYLRAILRFRGAGTFGPGDIAALLSMWQMLLDVPKANPTSFAPRPRNERIEPEAGDE